VTARDLPAVAVYEVKYGRGEPPDFRGASCVSTVDRDLSVSADEEP